MTDKEKLKRTDALTELADKYHMTAKDRTTLYKIYIAAAQLPPGWVAVPLEAELPQLHAAMKEDPRHVSSGRWNMMRDALADTYYRMIKARPPVPENKD